MAWYDSVKDMPDLLQQTINAAGEALGNVVNMGKEIFASAKEGVINLVQMSGSTDSPSVAADSAPSLVESPRIEPPAPLQTVVEQVQGVVASLGSAAQEAIHSIRENVNLTAQNMGETGAALAQNDFVPAHTASTGVAQDKGVAI